MHCMAIGLEDTNDSLYVPMCTDSLLQSMRQQEREDVTEWMVDFFKGSEDEVMQELAQGCRRWLSKAA